MPLAASIAGAALAAFALLVVLVRARRDRVYARLKRDVAADGLLAGEASVLFLGLKSRGGGQWRGNGALVATARELRFRGWWPARELVIARRDVVDVGSATSHAGRTVGMPLLVVRFRDPAGYVETAAWATRHLDAWVGALRGKR